MFFTHLYVAAGEVADCAIARLAADTLKRSPGLVVPSP